MRPERTKRPPVGCQCRCSCRSVAVEVGFDSLWKLPCQGVWSCLWMLFLLMVGMLSGPLAVAGGLEAAVLVRWWS